MRVYPGRTVLFSRGPELAGHLPRRGTSGTRLYPRACARPSWPLQERPCEHARYCFSKARRSLRAYDGSPPESSSSLTSPPTPGGIATWAGPPPSRRTDDEFQIEFLLCLPTEPLRLRTDGSIPSRSQYLGFSFPPRVPHGVSNPTRSPPSELLPFSTRRLARPARGPGQGAPAPDEPVVVALPRKSSGRDALGCRPPSRAAPYGHLMRIASVDVGVTPHRPQGTISWTVLAPATEEPSILIPQFRR